MEEQIKTKIKEIVDYIISKPVKTVTLNDYTILHEELKDLRLQKSQTESAIRFQQLMTAFPVPAGSGSTLE